MEASLQLRDFDIEITGATDPVTSTASSQASTIDGIDAIIGSLLEETSTTTDAFSDFITGNQLPSLHQAI